MVTDKAAKILQRMKRQDAMKASRLFGDPKARGRVLEAFNRENMDDVGPLGGAEQGMTILSEMNSLTDDHHEFVKSLAPR